MVSDETQEELIARRFFESLGCSVTRLPKIEGQPRAGYRVQDSANRYIVEVKGRGPDAEFARQLREHGSAGTQHRIARTNTISRQITEAAEQLEATDPNDTSSLRMIAFVAAGDDPDLQVD